MMEKNKNKKTWVAIVFFFVISYFKKAQSKGRVDSREYRDRPMSSAVSNGTSVFQHPDKRLVGPVRLTQHASHGSSPTNFAE